MKSGKQEEGGQRRGGGGVDGVCYCLCFINILLYKCQLYHFPHHCFTTPLALSSGTKGGTSLSLISLYRFSPSPLPESLYSFSPFLPSFLSTVFLSLLSLSFPFFIPHPPNHPSSHSSSFPPVSLPLTAMRHKLPP